MVFFVRVRAILDVAVDAHVPLGRVEVRAAVLHDGAVDLFLNCTSLLDDDNVVLAGCELLEAFVHATFDPATLWQLACRVHRASLALLPLHAGKWVRLAVLVLLDESASQRVMLLLLRVWLLLLGRTCCRHACLSFR